MCREASQAGAEGPVGRNLATVTLASLLDETGQCDGPGNARLAADGFFVSADAVSGDPDMAAIEAKARDEAGNAAQHGAHRGASRASPSAEALRARLGTRSLVLVGLPGAGKSSVGKRLAARLHLAFVDADCEIEKAAGLSIADIFERHGEPAFREGEERVIARLLQEGPQVLATGGGAFMSAATRAAIAQRGVAIWLDATTDVLVSRIAKRNHRPMFRNVNPWAKVKELRSMRDPMFAQAPIRVVSSAGPHERVVSRILTALDRLAMGEARLPEANDRPPS